MRWTGFGVKQNHKLSAANILFVISNLYGTTVKVLWIKQFNKSVFIARSHAKLKEVF